jgi:hypothetical protein
MIFPLVESGKMTSHVFSHSVTNEMIRNLRYGCISSNTDPSPDQTGGFDDFAAHVVATGVQIRS